VKKLVERLTDKGEPVSTSLSSSDDDFSLRFPLKLFNEGLWKVLEPLNHVFVGR